MAKKAPAKPRSNAKVKTGVGVIYARYSSHSQKDASIEQQVAECMQHAAEMGLTIIDTYADRAVSGKTDRRPAFQRMMKDAEKGHFQYVVAWKSNRIGRNMLQAMVNESKLEEMGIRVLYAEEDFDDTAAGRFALRSMMNVNQFYSENMAEDIRRGLQDNASKCKSNGSLPFGLCKDEDGRVDVNEAEAEIVREIYTRVASREPFADIMADLNARGIKTKRGARWNKGSFCTLLHNERYTGVYIYGDIRVDGGIPRIISDELFHKVQEVCRMKKNPQNGRHRTGAEDYLLTGKLRCGHCGSFMSGVSGTSRSGELHYYYTCQGRRAKTCHKKNIRRDVIERAVAQAIMIYCLTDDVIEWIADQTMAYWDRHDKNLQIEALENELAANKKATSNLLKAIEAGIITETTKSRLLELENEQAQLNSKLQAARADEVKIDRSDLVASLYLLRSGDVRDKKFQAELFRTFLLCVYVYDDNRLKILFSFTGDQASVEIPLETGENYDQPGDNEGSVCSFTSRIAPPRHLLQSKRVFFCLYCARRSGSGRRFMLYWEKQPFGQRKEQPAMQDRYAGDIGDYIKFGLLKALLQEDFRLGVNWYRTDPPDSEIDSKTGLFRQQDGKFRIPTGCEVCDPPLARALQAISDLDCSARSIAALEAAALLDPARVVYYHEPIRRTNRERWHQDAMKALADCNLVFLDPDNGLLPSSVGLGSARSVKYVLEDELSAYLSAGQSVVLYQHRPRRKKPDYFCRMAGRLPRSPAGSPTHVLTSHKGTVRDYFLIPADNGAARRFGHALAQLTASPWGTLCRDETAAFAAF